MLVKIVIKKSKSEREMLKIFEECQAELKFNQAIFGHS